MARPSVTHEEFLLDHEDRMVVVRERDPRLEEADAVAEVTRAVVAECARQLRGDQHARVHVVSTTIGQQAIAIRVRAFGDWYARERKFREARVVFAAVVARALG